MPIGRFHSSASQEVTWTSGRRDGKKGVTHSKAVIKRQDLSCKNKSLYSLFFNFSGLVIFDNASPFSIIRCRNRWTIYRRRALEVIGGHRRKQTVLIPVFAGTICDKELLC